MRLIQLIVLYFLVFPFILTLPAFAADGLANIDNVFVRTATGADSQHRPIGASSEFNAATNPIVVTFKSNRLRSQPGLHNIRFDIFSIDDDRPVATGAWVQFSHGFTYSTEIDTRRLGLVEGKYRLDLRSGGSNATLTFEILGRAPKAIELQPDEPAGELWSLENTQWQDLGNWSLSADAPNIALAALGGAVVDTAQNDGREWSAAMLIDGSGPVRDPVDFEQCLYCGWSDGRKAGTSSATVTFHQNRSAEIGSVVLDTRVFDWTGKNGHLPHFPKYVTLRIFDEGNSVVYQTEALVPQKPGRFMVPIPSGTTGRKVAIEITETHGGSQPVLAEIEVRERLRDGQSIVADYDVDLMRFGTGGALSHFTNFKEKGYVAYLFDQDDGTYWTSKDVQFPQDFTATLPGNKRAFVRAVEIELPRSQDPSTWPAQVAVAVGDDSPLTGLMEVARFAVPKTSGAHEFLINRDARFVQVRLLDNHGGPVTTMSRLSIIEGKRPGYVPVLLRPRQDEKADDTSFETADLEITEAEPNDDRNNASPLTAGQLTRGRIDPLGELDVFRLPQDTTQADTLSLLYEGIPNIRHTVAMQTCDGETFSSFDPGKIPASRTRVTFLIKGNECFTELSEPEASIVLVWDTSGSMQGRQEDLARALRLYLDRAPADQQIALIRFSDTVETNGRHFRDDKQALKNWAASRVEPDGSTRLYDALIEALDLLRDRRGNRGIIVLSDGFDTASEVWHAELWDRLSEDRVRIYTIGLGSDLNNYSAVYGTTGRHLLEQLALATDGQAFFTTDNSELRNFYGRIATELSSPAIYELTPLLESGEGELRLIATGEAVPAAAMPAVHVLFDVSGSMAERLPDGSPKIAVAKQAFDTILGELPDQTPFSFTAYGHRIPENPDKSLACDDIETLHQLAPIDKQAVFQSVNALSTQGGTTPLTRGVAEIANKFGGQAEGIIIAITDGIEECDSNPLKTIEDLKSAGLEKLQLDVVGFNLQDNASRDMMQKIAAIGGGQYYDASEGEALAKAMRLAASARYTVRDSSGGEVTRGLIGGPPVRLPPGWFTVEIVAADRTFSEHQVRIDDGARTTMRVLKVGARFDINTDPPLDLAQLAQQRQACGADALTRDSAENLLARRVQESLNALGFDVGAADGQPGRRTRAGILAFQARYGLDLEEAVSVRLEQHLDCVKTLGEPYQEDAK